jgi:hypothetical protein
VNARAGLDDGSVLPPPTSQSIARAPPENGGFGVSFLAIGDSDLWRFVRFWGRANSVGGRDGPTSEFRSLLGGFLFGLRVLFDHTYNFGPLDRAMPVFTKSGLIAVGCFFVISGFSNFEEA